MNYEYEVKTMAGNSNGDSMLPISQPSQNHNLKTEIRPRHQKISWYQSCCKSVNFFGLLTLGLASISLLLVFLLFSHFEIKTGEQQILNDGAALCNLITDTARQEFFINSGSRNLTLLDYVVREKGVAYCLILDNTQTPLLHLGQSLPEANPQLESNSWRAEYLLSQKYTEKQGGETIYEFAKPIYIQGEKTGLVRIGLNLSSYLHKNRTTNYLMGAIGFLLFSLAITFYFLLKNMLSPLYNINQNLTAMIIEKKDFPHLTLSSNGEFGQLARTMNLIFENVQKKTRKLEEANGELEVANKILLYEKSRLRAILDNLKIGLVFLDSSGKAIQANHLAKTYLKIGDETYLGRPFEEFLQQDHPELAHFFYEFRQKGNIYGHDFIEIKAKDGDTPIILGHDCFYLFDHDDTPMGFLWTITETTSQKQAESSRHEFVNHVAHELKTPLNTLRSYSEMLLDDEVSDEQNKREFVNSINQETLRLSRLINNLLNISKMEMGCLKVNRTLIKMDKLLFDCYQTVKTQAAGKAIHFVCDVADKMPNMMLDKDLMEVAILNLLTNAIKYTPEAGQINLKGLVEEDRVLIRVTDSGYGIAEDEIKHIFDKFYRSPREEIRKESGTGLGLSLAKNIIQLHKGDIQVESTIGHGSSFTLIFPLEEVYI